MVIYRKDDQMLCLECFRRVSDPRNTLEAIVESKITEVAGLGNRIFLVERKWKMTPSGTKVYDDLEWDEYQGFVIVARSKRVVDLIDAFKKSKYNPSITHVKGNLYKISLDGHYPKEYFIEEVTHITEPGVVLDSYVSG